MTAPIIPHLAYNAAVRDGLYPADRARHRFADSAPETQMIPRTIFNQPIGNHTGDTWLRAINDMEHDNEPAPATVYQAPPPPVRPPASRGIPGYASLTAAPSRYARALTAAASTAPDTNSTEGPLGLHRPDEQVESKSLLTSNAGE